MIIEINRKRHLWELWLWIYFTRRFHIYRTWAKLSLTFCILIYKGIQMDWINMTAFYIFITIFVCFCLFVEINKIPKRWKALQKKEKKWKEMTLERKKKIKWIFSTLLLFALLHLFYSHLFYFLYESDNFVVSDGYIHTHTTVCMYLDVYPNPNLPNNHSYWFFFFPRGKQMKLQAKC